jgi:hypothetical protein
VERRKERTPPIIWCRVAGAPAAERVGLHVVVEKLVGVEIRAVGGEEEDFDFALVCRGAMGIAGGMWRVKLPPFCLFLASAEAF